MYKKHLILGIGIGIFISCLIFYLAFQIYKNNNITTDEVSYDYEEEYVIERATDLGMIFFDRISFESGRNENKGNDDSQNESTIGEESEQDEFVLLQDNFVYITIPKNSTAIEVSAILEEKGLIEDKADFTNYIVNENLQRKLQFGDFLIYKDANYEQLLDILIRKN